MEDTLHNNGVDNNFCLLLKLFANSDNFWATDGNRTYNLLDSLTDELTIKFFLKKKKKK